MILIPKILQKTTLKTERTLTSRESSTVRIRSPKGTAVIEISKTEFENAISTMIAQAEMTCETLLDDSNLSPSDIDEVILVGGSTRIPMVKESKKSLIKSQKLLEILMRLLP